MPEISEQTATAFIEMFAGYTGADVGCRFSCGEAEQIADVMRDLGDHAAVNDWLWSHADGDDDTVDLHPVDICKLCDRQIRGDGPWPVDPDRLRWVGKDGKSECDASSDTPALHVPTAWEEGETDG